MLLHASQQTTGKLCQWSLVAMVRCRHSTVSGSLNKIDTSSQEEYKNALPYSSLPGPKGIPWFGKWFDYKLNPSKVHRRDLVVKEFYSKYGYIVKETIAGRDNVHLFHPDFLKQIYETEGKYPAIPPLVEPVKEYRKIKNFAPGLGNSNGEEWYRLRKIVQNVTLKPHKSLNYLPLQNRVAEDFVNRFDSLISKNGEIPKFNRWVERWGIESGAHNCLEVRMGYLQDDMAETVDKIIDASSMVLDISVKLSVSLALYKLFPTPSMKKLFACENYINSIVVQLFATGTKLYRQALEGNKLTGNHLMFFSYLLGNKDITEKETVTLIVSFLLDTVTTTAQMLLFNLYTLASNPQAQEKAFEEAKQLLSPSGELTAEGFSNCTYIKACLKETFRLFPIGYDVQRLCPRNTVIGGYQIPKGTLLSLNNYCYSTDPNVLPDPDVFSPERWTREETVKKAHPYMLSPFSLGRRMCVGRRFAEQDLVTLISKILSRYRLEWHYGELHQHFRLLNIPDQEVKIKFIPR